MRLVSTIFAMGAACLLGGSQVAAAAPIRAVSPDGRVQIELSVQDSKHALEAPHFRVTHGGKEALAPSPIGLELEGGFVLGQSCEVVDVESRTVSDEFTQVTGKRRAVRVDAAEVAVVFRETTAPNRKWEFVMRAADDGVAFRYRIPQQDGWDSLVIQQERTAFQVSANARAFALPLKGYATSYENRYQHQPVKELSNDRLLGLPLLLESPGGPWVAITEANVTEYAGMYLIPSQEGTLSTRLSPHPEDPATTVRHALPHASPWRVVMVGDNVGRFVESDFVLSLNEPCAIEDTSWIRTGKTTFPWWNGFHEEAADFKPGMNTATARYYIDFCAENGIQCHSLDGIGNTAWYGGPIMPYEGAEPTKGGEGLDLPEVLKYARSKNVRIRLWMHWKAAEMHMAKAFPLYREWGVEGVMLDFMDRDDQEMNRFIRNAVALAAENQLTVTLHGCSKPTGLERTYPNLLTHEAVMNLEHDKWDPVGITPDHEVTVAFTRMLAGPLDFHQGSFRTVRQDAFEPRNEAPLVIGTPARTLASYIVYQNHLSMVADYPSAYRDHPALPALAAIPTTWDDTKVLDHEIGKFVVIARRSGDAWHVGAMTDGHARSIEVPLRFLAPGRYAAEAWSDDQAAKYGISRRETMATSASTLRLQLDAAGGAYVRIQPE